jgi:general secretion pathway protein G
MSLLEIMVVITLIGLVTAVIGVSVMGRLRDGQIATARQQAMELAKSIEIYQLQRGNLPASGNGLAELTAPPPIVATLPTDPWGQAYIYLNPGSKNPYGFDVRSIGPDGIEGTEDDVGNWNDARSLN